MGQNVTDSAPGVSLPIGSDHRNRLRREVEEATAWAEEFVIQLEEHTAQVLARRNLKNHLGAIDAALMNVARQPVMDAMMRNIADLLVDRRRRLVKGLEVYFEVSNPCGVSLDELLFQYVPNNEYAVDTLAKTLNLAAALRSRYLEPLHGLRARLGAEPAPAPEPPPVPFVWIQVGDDTDGARPQSTDSFIEYGLEGAPVRRRISLTFQVAAILKMIQEAPFPGFVSADYLNNEALKRGWAVNAVRWNRVFPVLEKALTSALKGLVGSSGRVFFDRAVLARACQKLVS